MPQNDYLLTSESVSEGHPDKICDQISDTILDAYMLEDPESRLGCETLATTNFIAVAGEVRGPQKVYGQIEPLVRDCVRDIGYEQAGFHWEKLKIMNLLHAQSSDIAQGVDHSDIEKEGAGDQGLMFGFAVDETEDLMPAPLHYAHAILRRLSRVRKDQQDLSLGPDSKSQITVRYVDGKPREVTSIVLSIQHFDDSLSSLDVRSIVEPHIRKTLPPEWITKHTLWHVNPTGKFVIGGPDGDCGLTGRKIIVDTYGGAAPHGGGAFSGKDPTKVDRSAAYMARYLAKNIVAAGLTNKCTVQLSYAIGVSEPQSMFIDTHGQNRVDTDKIAAVLCQSVDLTPRGIRDHLGLGKPIYQRTASFGHFGRKPDDEGGFSWEKTDLASELAALL